VKSVKSVIQHLTLRACVLIDCDDWFIPVYKQDSRSPTSPTSPTNTVPMWLVSNGARIEWLALIDTAGSVNE
jgi:hypothetical protein